MEKGERAIDILAGGDHGASRPSEKVQYAVTIFVDVRSKIDDELGPSPNELRYVLAEASKVSVDVYGTG